MPDGIQREVVDKTGADLKAFEHVKYCLTVRKNQIHEGNDEKNRYKEEKTMLRIEHLSKTYGGKKAVDDLNLHIAPGEIYGFISHNGAGKTTTLKSIAGILQFDVGEIYIDGKSIRTAPLECKYTFAYIPDNPDLYDYMKASNI